MPAKTNDKPVKITVKFQDTSDIIFLVKKDSELIKMKTRFAHTLGQSPNALRFLFDGRRVADTDTPKSLGMQNNEVIEVYQDQIGG